MNTRIQMFTRSWTFVRCLHTESRNSVVTALSLSRAETNEVFNVSDGRKLALQSECRHFLTQFAVGKFPSPIISLLVARKDLNISHIRAWFLFFL